MWKLIAHYCHMFAYSCHTDDKRATENSESLRVAAEGNRDEVFVRRTDCTSSLKKETGPQKPRVFVKDRVGK